MQHSETSSPKAMSKSISTCLIIAIQLFCVVYFRTIAKAVIEKHQWPLALRGIYKRRGKYTTALRELIVKMPGIVIMRATCACAYM